MNNQDRINLFTISIHYQVVTGGENKEKYQLGAY